MILRALGRFLAGLGLLLAIGWGALALWIDGPASRVVAGVLAAGFVAVSLLVLVGRRSWLGRLLVLGALLLVVIGWWSGIPPRNDRDWRPEVAVLPTAEIDGDRVAVRNIRNFDYRSETEFTPRYYDRVVDLSRITAVDLFVSYWGPKAVAHTITSWEFDDGPPLAISIETRPERGESYSALRGFFKQYELTYVVADERDVVRLRSNYRGEHVFLYRLPTNPVRGRALLLDYLEVANRLAQHPEFYNALTDNCTTGIRFHFQNVGRPGPWSWKVLANGYLDELLYARGQVDTSLPFAEFKSRSWIGEQARAADHDPEFSRRIRDGRPGFGAERSAVSERSP